MDLSSTMPQKVTIGRDTPVTFADLAMAIPAKVDTGADTSAIWASDISVDKEGKLHFKLFDQGSPYYTGNEIVMDDYSVAKVKSASGHTVVKYKVIIPVSIHGREYEVCFGLSNRSKLKYPILIGRESLSGNFIVDVELKETTIEEKTIKQPEFNKLMRNDPYKFYTEHFLNGVDKQWELQFYQTVLATIPLND